MPLDDNALENVEREDEEPVTARSFLTKDDKKKRRRLILALAALYLAVEKDTRSRVTSAVRTASLAALGLRSIASPPDDLQRVLLSPAVYQNLAARADDLEQSVRSAFLEERKRARQAVFLLLVRFGYADLSKGRSDSYRQSVEAHDRMWTAMASQSLRDAWLRLHMTALALGSKRSFAEARKTLRPRIETTATTDVGRVINHEMATLALESPMVQTVFEWQAILDEATCGACEERDGTIVEPSDFPPLHPRCRCFVIPRQKLASS